MRLKFWHKQESIVNLTQMTGHNPIKLDVRGITGLTIHHTYAQKPPPPRPARITVTWVMMDGTEYRTWIPLNGQAEWTENMPHYIQSNAEKVVCIRYSLGYNDGSSM